MRKLFLLPLAIALSIFVSCEKQQSAADRQAEIDREVQQRLEAERTAQQREELARREGELSAREQALNQQKQQSSVATVESENKSAEREPSRDRERVRERDRDRESSIGSSGGGSYGLFYTKLESDGDWLETNDYGYVWRPHVARRSRTWRPYLDGHWVYTDAGWTWVSEEPFGWATYHYGRWTRLRNVGWVWVPGEEWAPAWVSWRKSDQYVGWAPLPPEARFDRHTGIHNWADNYYDIGPENYSFVSTTQLGGQRLETDVIPVERNITIINQTTNVTNITYSNTTVVNEGPNYDELRGRSQQPIERFRLERDVNVNVNLGDSRPVVRGQVISMHAPVIPRAQAVERPPTITERVTHAVVERGWEGITDRKAADQARAKMQSEATPPPNAPPKTFVRPVAAATPAPSASPAESRAMPTVSATASPSPSAAAEASASATPSHWRGGHTATASATMTPSSAISASPSASAISAATPVSSASPSASASAMRSPRTRETPTPPAPSATPAATSTATVAATATATPRLAITPRATSTPRPVSTPKPSPSISASPTPAASASSPASTSSTANSASQPTPYFGRVKSMRKAAEENERTTGKPFPGATVIPDTGDKPIAPERTPAASGPPSLPPRGLPARGRALEAEPRRVSPAASASVSPSPATESSPGPHASASASPAPPNERTGGWRGQPGAQQSNGAATDQRRGPRGRGAPSPSPSASPTSSPSPAA